MPEPETLDTDEPLPRRMERHAFDRLIMLSDGVFAIAMTLAAIEIRPPETPGLSLSALVSSLAGSLATYAISFAVIGAYWLAHRRIFGMLRRVDLPFTLLNLLLLAFVALQPAGVQLLTHLGPQGAALELYFAMIVCLGLVQSTLWGYAAFVARLLDPQVSRAYRISQLAASLLLPIVAAGLGVFSSRTGSKPLMIGAVVAIAAIGVARRRFTRQPG
jgi:uncharacterized membrane protein